MRRELLARAQAGEDEVGATSRRAVVADGQLERRRGRCRRRGCVDRDGHPVRDRPRLRGRPATSVRRRRGLRRVACRRAGSRGGCSVLRSAGVELRVHRRVVARGSRRPRSARRRPGSAGSCSAPATSPPTKAIRHSTPTASAWRARRCRRVYERAGVVPARAGVCSGPVVCPHACDERIRRGRGPCGARRPRTAVGSLGRRVTTLDWIIVVFAAAQRGVRASRRASSSARCRWSASRPARSSAPARAALSARAARSRPTRRCSGCSARCAGGAHPRPRASRRSATRLRARAARSPGLGVARRLLGGAALAACRRARAGVARRAPSCCRRPARADAARRRPALGDPARAQRRAAAVRADPQRARALRPVPAHRRARRPTSPAPRAAIARDPQVRAAARQRRASCSGTACGLGRRGLGLGRGATASSSPTRTSSPGESDTIVAAARRRARSCAAHAVAFDPRNDIAILRVAGLGRPRAARSAADPARGHGGRDPRLPARTARSTSAPARLGATRAGAHPGRLRPRAGPALDHRAARPRAPGQLGRPGGRRRRPRARRPSSPRRRGGRAAGGYGVPNAIVRERAGGDPARHGLDRALRGLSRRAPLPCARPMGKTLVIAEKPSVGPRPRPRAARARSRSTPARGEDRALARGPRARHHVGRRPPRPARRARRVRRQVQEVADGRPADRARARSSSSCATSARRSR